MPEYIQPNTNMQLENDEEEIKISLGELRDEELLSVIDKTSEIHKSMTYHDHAKLLLNNNHFLQLNRTRR